MKLKKLSFKNFKSYSNILTEISFDDSSSLNFIVGENGTGKTSIAECITYLIYGKLENFTSSDIPNRINKNFYGCLEMDCDGHQVIIERGLNPGLFKVQIDGNVIDTAGKQNVQDMLEENYFKIPYTVFHNILVLEVGEVKSLLSMGAADKRNIIDKICGFTLYNKFKEFVKSDMKSLDEKITINTTEMKTINSNLASCENQIREIKENNVTQEELDDLITRIKDAKEMKEKNETMLKKLRDAGDKLKSTNISNVGEYNNIKEKIQVIDKKIGLIDMGKCPTCGSSLDTDDFHNERKELIRQKDDYISQMKMIKEMVDKIKPKLTLLENKEQSIKMENNKIPLTDLQSDYKYKKMLNDRGTISVDNLKKKLSENLEELNKKKNELENEKEVMNFLTYIFSDDGIKKYISSTYIPVINNLMVDMLRYMNLNYSVVFDNNFDAEIKQNGVKVKYQTLSKGEKRRVDFAAVISFIKFLKIQFGELNLLFLDEIFSNVDVNGVNDMIEILRDLSSDLGINIYLIHHARLEGVMFDKIIQTKKIDGFSRLEFN